MQSPSPHLAQPSLLLLVLLRFLLLRLLLLLLLPVRLGALMLGVFDMATALSDHLYLHSKVLPLVRMQVGADIWRKCHPHRALDHF